MNGLSSPSIVFVCLLACSVADQVAADDGPVRPPLPPLIPEEVLALPPVDTTVHGPVHRRDIASLPERSWRHAARGALDLVDLRPILFARDSDRLDDAARRLLARAIRFIESHASSVRRILIQARCDETASADYNYRLAARRARAVREVLLDARIDDDLLSIQALGEAMPVDEPWTRSGRRLNRRVDVHILLRGPAGLPPGDDPLPPA